MALHPRRDLIRAALAALAFTFVSAQAAPQKAVFASEIAATQWPLAAFDPQLPTDWSEYGFLVIEFRASSSQSFELALIAEEGTVSRRIHPFANVWTRASIPLAFYSLFPGSSPGQVPGQPRDTGASKSAIHQPRAAYWIKQEAGDHGPVRNVRAIGVTMRHPAHAATLEIRKVSLSKTDVADAVLDGGMPVIDDFGQYIHADWPGKARAVPALVREWSQESRLLVPKAVPSTCRYGGYESGRRRASGFFRVEKIANRWWFVDPSGCRFWSAGVNGAGGEPPFTPIVGRDKLFASIPTSTQEFAPGATGDAFRDPISPYAANLMTRFGTQWRAESALLASRRMRAWGLNTAVGAALNESLPAGLPVRQPYVYPLRGGESTDGAIMGMPDVYSDDFVRRVDADVAQQLAPRRADAWMIGYSLGNGPPWLGQEHALVDRVLAGPASALQQRFRAELAQADTPATREAMVHAAFRRYLEIVNAAARRHAPDHLNLGVRFGGASPDDVLALARGFDVVTLNQYRWAPPKDFIDRVYAVQNLPILIGEFHFGAPERGLAPGLAQTMNQSERGVAYSYYVENAAAHPAIVGTHWHQWIDQPATGRRDGENYNIGWIDVTDRPYPELVAAAKASHARIDAIHSGRLAPTSRRPKASEFGTPAVQ